MLATIGATPSLLSSIFVGRARRSAHELSEQEIWETFDLSWAELYIGIIIHRLQIHAKGDSLWSAVVNLRSLDSVCL